MNPNYKLKIFDRKSDFWPYTGISHYISRNQFEEGTLKMADDKTRWRSKLLEIYNISFGVGAMLAFSINEKTLKNGLEYLIAKIF